MGKVFLPGPWALASGFVLNSVSQPVVLLSVYIKCLSAAQLVGGWFGVKREVEGSSAGTFLKELNENSSGPSVRQWWL